MLENQRTIALVLPWLMLLSPLFPGPCHGPSRLAQALVFVHQLEVAGELPHPHVLNPVLVYFVEAD